MRCYLFPTKEILHTKFGRGDQYKIIDAKTGKEIHFPLIGSADAIDNCIKFLKLNKNGRWVMSGPSGDRRFVEHTVYVDDIRIVRRNIFKCLWVYLRWEIYWPAKAKVMNPLWRALGIRKSISLPQRVP